MRPEEAGAAGHDGDGLRAGRSRHGGLFKCAAAALPVERAWRG
jgi:hypothetical protein